jgi:hypothetical protein
MVVKMTKQEQLRAILAGLQVTHGLTWKEAKNHVCGLLTKSPATIDKWLTTGVSSQDISDNELDRLKLKIGPP